LTARGRLLYGNPAFHRILGRNPGAGNPLQLFRKLLANPTDLVRIVHAMADTGQVNIPELELRGQEGKPQWISLTQSLRWSRESGRVIDGMIEDITCRKKLEADLSAKEEELRQSQKLESIGKLAAGVAHDFNNRLTAIIGYSELLLESGLTADSALACLSEIHSSAKQAANLTQQLLAFGRRQMLFPKKVDLNDFLSELEPVIRGMAGAEIEVTFQLAGDLGKTMIDPFQLRIVIINLVQNALEAMQGKGRLALQTGSRLDGQTGLFIQVTDTGIGMEKEIQARIFEPFFTTKKPAGQNRGLGLSTVYGIVKQCSGFISVDSSPGQGSKFKVYLPWLKLEEPNLDKVPLKAAVSIAS